MKYVIHRSILVIGDTAIRSHATRLRKYAEIKIISKKALCGEWPAANGLEDKQALSALHVQPDRNSGLPKGCKAQGNGVSIVPENEKAVHMGKGDRYYRESRNRKEVA